MPCRPAFAVDASPPDGYRMRARLHVQRGTHRVLSRRHALALRPRARRASCCPRRSRPSPRFRRQRCAPRAARHRRRRGVGEPRRHGTRPPPRAAARPPSGELDMAASDRRRDRHLGGRAGGFRDRDAAGTPFVADTLTVPAQAGPVRFTLDATRTRSFRAIASCWRMLVGRVARPRARPGVCSICMPASACSAWPWRRAAACDVARRRRRSTVGRRSPAQCARHSAPRSSRAHQAVETFLAVEPRPPLVDRRSSIRRAPA